MPPSAVNATVGLPRWLVVLGSLLIAGHLLAVLGLALAVRTDPLPTPFGGSTTFAGPKFAQVINDVAMPHYLRFLKMTQNYHFASNRPGIQGVMFEVRLRDGEGKEMAVLKFPDPKANAWVRHRQGLLARGLAEEQPVEAIPGEAIAAPGQRVEEAEFWDGPDQHQLRLRRAAQHLVPRDRPVTGPTPWSLVLAQSYARYLCRTHGAASAEVIRHMHHSIPPMILFEREPPPPGLFEDFIADFGEFRQ
jgi:hypothetical protein